MKPLKPILHYISDNLSDISRRKKIIYFSISIIIAFLLAAPEDITWARDRLNYLTYAESSWIILQRYLSDNILAVFSNEPLFLAINIVLSTFISPDNVIRVIIFTSTIGVLYALGKMTNYNFWILVLFICIPQVVKNHVIHLRQGLGLSVYLIGLSMGNKYGNILKCASVFIHISTAFLILFEILEKLLKQKIVSFRLRMFVSSILMVLFILLIPILANLFGDRRAEVYEFSLAQGTIGLGFIIWIIAGSLFLLTIKKNYINIIACYGVIFYLISYFFLDFGARVFENIIPLILVAVINEQRKIQLSFIGFLLLYGAALWYVNGFSYLVNP